MTDPVKFLYQRGQSVKLKDTGDAGTVEYCGTEGTTGTPFYRIQFHDGTTRNVAESDLWPA
jgi:hypothetical protein